MDLCLLHRNRLVCFCLLVQWENFLEIFLYASPTHGAASGFNDGGKNEKWACPDVAGIQLELEEQAKLLELLF